MFGYHNNPNCYGDIWAPRTERISKSEEKEWPQHRANFFPEGAYDNRRGFHDEQFLIKPLDHRPHQDNHWWEDKAGKLNCDVVENRAFSPYAVHQQAIDDAIEYIMRTGNTSFETDEELTEDDLWYIELTLRQRGFYR